MDCEQFLARLMSFLDGIAHREPQTNRSVLTKGIKDKPPVKNLGSRQTFNSPNRSKNWTVGQLTEKIFHSGAHAAFYILGPPSWGVK